MSYARQHLQEAARIIESLDADAIERVVGALAEVRARGGRLFFLGVGGSAGNCSHAVNDFRKLAGFEAYAPTDNVSELTARTNDEGWETVFAAWLSGSRLRREDAVFVFSVGGGSLEKNISANLVRALAARQKGRRNDRWRRRARRRLHRAGRRCVRHHPDGQSRHHYTAQRGVPGGRLAPARVASAAQGGAYEMGIDAVRTTPAVFLDRDGVINRAIVRDGHPYAPHRAEDLEVLPGVHDALVRLKAAGFALVVVTNQPDVARGTLPETALRAMHERLTAAASPRRSDGSAVTTTLTDVTAGSRRPAC